jgi:hypothetical protein
MATIKYSRLTRERSTKAFSAAFQSRSALWLGPDHVLLVETSGFTESYKRFYFRDIQAFTLQVTGRRAAWNWGLGATITGLSLMALWLARDMGTGGTITFFSFILVLLGIPLLINNLMGPTCQCRLQTAVQTEDLPSLSRVGRARKFINIVRPMIAAAQGTFAPGELAAGLSQPASAPVASSPAPESTPPGSVPPVLS